MNMLDTELKCACSVCDRIIYENDSLTCTDCQAVFYCSLSCKQLDWLSSANPDHSHCHWCSKMKSFMLWEPLLCQLPFTYAPVTTSPTFTESVCASLLLSLGVLGEGLWKYECHFNFSGNSWDCISSPGAELRFFSSMWTTSSLLEPCCLSDIEACLPDVNCFSYEDAMLRAFVSPSEALQLSFAPSGVCEPCHPFSLVTVDLLDWAAYYFWRGLVSVSASAGETTSSNSILSSPLAILLHWPLTVYHILAHLLPRSSPNTISTVLGKQSVVIHIIGVEQEVSLLPVFKELDHLIRPDVRVRLFFIGTYIDQSVENTVFHLSRKLSVSVWRGLYHEFMKSSFWQDTENQPDIIIAFNAGLAAYKSWPPTLEALTGLNVPSYFTDACLYSCTWGYRVAQTLGLGDGVCTQALDTPTTSAEFLTGYSGVPLLNPFRSPLRIPSGSTRWGWFRNAFVFTPLRIFSPTTASNYMLQSAMAQLHV